MTAQHRYFMESFLTTVANFKWKKKGNKIILCFISELVSSSLIRFAKVTAQRRIVGFIDIHLAHDSMLVDFLH